MNRSFKGILFFVLMTLAFGLGAQTVTLTFTGRGSDNHYVSLNKVVINNLTKNCQETIWWPDTTLTMQNGTGIDEYFEDGGFVLSQNNPNPFSGTTDVFLTVAEKGKIQIASFWTSTQSSSDFACKRDIDGIMGNVFSSTFEKNNALSFRCLRD